MDIVGLLQAISVSTGSPSKALIEQWRSLIKSGRANDALFQIINGYLDPLGPVDPSAHRRHVISLASLAVDAVATEVDQWCNPDVWNAAKDIRSG